MALGELQISWVGSDEGEILATDEFDIPAASAEVAENQIEEEENV
jgi:segregation and condensation protein A